MPAYTPKHPFWSRVLRDMGDALTACARLAGGLTGLWLVLWADHALRGDDGLLRWATSTDLTLGQVVVAILLAHLVFKD